MSPRPEAATPESDAWLGQLLEDSPLLPERRLVQAWLRLLPYLPPSLRYELAAILREHATDSGGKRSAEAVTPSADLAVNEQSGEAPSRVGRDAWIRWQRAAGPWARWSLCLPLVGPGLAELSALPTFRAQKAATRVASRVAHHLREDGPSLIILDLPPALGAQVAANLSRAALARPVLYLPRWPYRRAVLPAEALVGTLVAESRRLGPGTATSVALVLDGERELAPVPASPGDARVDNRYQVDSSELPDTVALRREGVTRVLDVREKGSDPPTDFTTFAYPRYRRAGLVVSHLGI